ncbi:aminotransferase class V-fold PLP-dependent enzyme [Pelagicoccus albus]|uniref:Aminotransferase class V-fold PLP-dependent enzyme n=1 Tax=Pelagicoccus albus TaxID=415222 RepID=A0A7X1E9T8_9BACT|nr:aminotransferase class V-fold PLP-dependent enzyme [Pelagicoccus albus]MBC2607533.1 aminotransferase class V-fold PLP-dependent enzyme [Pelagicoccus albus]
MDSQKENRVNSELGAPLARREWLAKAGLLSLAAGTFKFGARGASEVKGTGSKPSGGLAGLASEFEVASTYLNSASIHPITTKAAQAIATYQDGRLMNEGASKSSTRADRQKVFSLFGKMVNAEPEELSFVPSTLVGENTVCDGLGITGAGSRVVTDEYHFMGGMYRYMELEKRGLDLEVVKAKDNRIRIEDLDKAITPETDLVAITLVSNVAGFQHDLKAVCEIAHSRGVPVYADLIQAAGVTPIDLKESGVDFAACSTYKWLMGDFGIGLMYAKRESQELLTRTRFGYWQRAKWETNYSPFDEPNNIVPDSPFRPGLSGLMGVGTIASAGVAALSYSLELLDRVGVAEIEKWRQPLLRRLHEALPSQGYLAMTPEDSKSSILSFARKDLAETNGAKLEAMGVKVSMHTHHVRISPSFFNDMDDIERLIEALA